MTYASQANNSHSPTCAHGGQNVTSSPPAQLNNTQVDDGRLLNDNIEIGLSRLSINPCISKGCRACSFEGVRTSLTLWKRLYRKEIRALEAQLPHATDDFFADARIPLQEDIERQIANVCADWHIKINVEQDQWEREWGFGADQDPDSGKSVFEIHREIIGRRWWMELPDEITGRAKWERVESVINAIR